MKLNICHSVNITPMFTFKHKTCNTHTNIQTYRHTNIRAYTYTNIHYTAIQAYRHTNIHSYKHTNIHTYTHTSIHSTHIQTYKHANIQTCKHTNMQTYKHTNTLPCCTFKHTRSLFSHSSKQKTLGLRRIIEF